MATYNQIQHDEKTVRCEQIGFGCNDSENDPENDIVNCQDCLEEGELLEIIVPNESVLLDVKKDPNEMLFLNMSDVGAGNIFQKLKQAQKIAETQVREGMSTAIGEIIRLRKSHTKTKWQLEAKCTTLEKLAQAEKTLRMAADKELQKVTNQKLCAEQIADEANRKCSDLERENARLQADLKKYKIMHAEEIERITEEKLRAEHIGTEADRQCALLNRENARLQQDLKATRLKFAYSDAQRRDFRLQLTTLRATLGLLSREPLPSPHVPVQPSRSGPNHIISGNGQSQDPQHAPTAGVFRSRAPTWVSISADKQDTADEVSPPNDDMSKPSNNDSPKPSNDDMPQPSKDDTSQPSNDDSPKPSNDDMPQPSNDNMPQPSNDDMPQPSNDDMPQSSMPQTSNEDVSKSTHEDGGSSPLDDNRVAGATSDWDETYSDFEFSVISTVSDTDDGDDDGFDRYENDDDDAFDLSDDEDEYSYDFDNETAVL